VAGPLKPDSWYENLGVEPPEHIVHTGSADPIKPDNHKHQWQARGNLLHCDQGQNGHGVPFDHVNKILVGTSPEGAPIYKDVVLANQAELDKLKSVSNTGK